MTNLLNHPQIELISPEALVIPKTHARKHGRNIEHLSASIERWGFTVPITVGADNVVASGVGRLLAARQLKLELVPVIRVQFLSEADRRAFALADNRLAELSSWDEAALREELTFLFEAEYDFSVTGFDMADLDLGAAASSDAEPPVELPDDDAVAVSRHGDLWLVGEHRLYCGNARDLVSFEALMADERARLVFSDLPYNVAINGHVSGLGKVKHREFAEASGEMSPAEFIAFMRRLFQLAARFSHDGSIHYYCMDWRHIREILDAADGVLNYKQLVVWAKKAGGMGAFYRSRHELIFVFKSGTEKHVSNLGLSANGRYRTNVWEMAGANTFRKGRMEDLEAHPTVKPIALVADAILDCSNRDDVILDFCVGSGTTLLAAHRTKRRGYAIEIDPLYSDLALRRLSALTGIEPVLSDGRSFNEVANDRAEEQVDG